LRYNRRMEDNLAALKAALRKEMRPRRRELARQHPDAAERAADALPMERLPAFAIVSGYRAQGSEIDPAPLVARLCEHGALICLPACHARGAPLEFREWEPDDPLVPDAMGIPSPADTAPPAHPDLVIAPVLAFDRKGGRLGQGAGFYDLTLAELRARKRVFVLGLAFAGQEVGEVPMGPLDHRLDAILTEDGLIEPAKD
jgi:5-formyltetrahydrofolate cyclo-ligase